jgi:hypothetical protein
LGAIGAAAFGATGTGAGAIFTVFDMPGAVALAVPATVDFAALFFEGGMIKSPEIWLVLASKSVHKLHRRS